MFAGQVMAGAAFIVTVAVTGVPGQPLATGVIVNVTVTGELVVLVSVPEISPEPLAGIPDIVPVLSLVQLKTVPVTLPVSAIVVIGPEHTVCEAGVAVTIGVGSTVMVNVTGVPVHTVPPLLYSGVTVISATTGELLVLTAENTGISPVPEAGRPIEGVLLVHL